MVIADYHVELSGYMAKGKTSSHLGTYPLNSLSRSFTSDAHISIAEKPSVLLFLCLKKNIL